MFIELVRLTREYEKAVRDHRETCIEFSRKSVHAKVAADMCNTLREAILIIRNLLSDQILQITDAWVDDCLKTILDVELPQSTYINTDLPPFINMTNALSSINPSEVTAEWSSEDDWLLSKVKTLELLKKLRRCSVSLPSI